MRHRDRTSEGLSARREGGSKPEARKKKELAKKPKLKPNQTESRCGGWLVLIEDVYNIDGL